MVLSLVYKRPEWVDPLEFRQRCVSGTKPAPPGGIPDSLSFDNIIKGETCPPLTTRDFMNYLLHIEHSAENLQFYLWFQDYHHRFSQASTSDILLAPEWTPDMHAQTSSRIRKLPKPPPIPTISTSPISPSTSYFPNEPDTAHAFHSAGATIPFTIQPFREEINRIIATYLTPHAPRQLNLSSHQLKQSLHALSYTTHPSALSIALAAVDTPLRYQAHPNFIRWSIRNANPPRVVFAQGLGCILLGVGFSLALLLTLSSDARALRTISLVPCVLGVGTFFAARKGMCIILHGLHRRHLRPWELWDDAKREKEGKEGKDEGGSTTSFGSYGSGKSYEDEPWVKRYEERSVVQKVLDREVWIEEPMLRQIQDTIFVQAVLVALGVGGVIVAIFVAVPAGNLY